MRGIARWAALIAILAVGPAGCGSTEDESARDGVFDQADFPFTFQYPTGFQEIEDVSVNATFGTSPSAMAAVGIKDRGHDVLLVEVRRLYDSVTETNLSLAQAELDSLIAPLTGDRGSQRTDVAGLPALIYDGVAAPGIDNAESRMVIIFNGDQQYTINCQSTPPVRQRIDRACKLALGTFELK